MNISSHLSHLILAVAASVLTTPILHAQSLVIEAFDNGNVDGWSATWGTSPELTFGQQNSGKSTTSGSLRVAADYFTPEDNGWEQMVIMRTFETPVVGSDYASVSVDVKVDPSSVATAGGQYGYFELKRPNGTAMGGVNLTSTNWTTVTFKIAPTEGTLNGIIIQNGNGGFRGPIVYYLDNFVFTKAVGSAAPPKVMLTRSTSSGLRLYASAPGPGLPAAKHRLRPLGGSGQHPLVGQPTPADHLLGHLGGLSEQGDLRRFSRSHHARDRLGWRNHARLE